MDNPQILQKYFPDFSEEQKQLFFSLGTLYSEWNEKINVISRKDIDCLYEKHVLHSLSIAAVFDFTNGSEIIDIGTGGGFPGIPLAIFFPEVQFHLVDSIAKKLKVVDAIAKEINLKNVTTEHTRVAEIRNRKFDFAVSRAVAPLKDLWRWSTPLLRNSNPRIQDPRSKIQDPRPKIQDPKSKTQNPKLAAGLICLKGGDLAQEISESGTRPRIMEIAEIFPEDFFREKYVLYVPL